MRRENIQKLHQVLLRLVALLIVCVLSAQQAVPQAKGDCPRSKPLHEPSYNSFFGKQSRVAVESDNLRVELVGKKLATRMLPEFSLRVTKKHSGADSKLALCNETEQVDELDIVGETRVLVLGRAAANSPVATIIDISSGRIVDHFACFMPSISPDHRFLAFVKSFPGHPGPVEITAEYIVYDLTRGPAENRSGLKSVESDAGRVVYPVGKTNTPGSNILPEGQPYHQWASRGLFWIDKDELAFGDGFEGHTTLVVVDSGSGAQIPRLRTIDLEGSKFVNLSQCKQSYSDRDFDALSQNLAGLINIARIERDYVCLDFVSNPCLKYSERLIRLP